MIITGLRAEPIDSAPHIDDLSALPRTGAVATFEGLTREDTVNGRRVVALTYEAHETLAGAQLDDLAGQAMEKWPLTGVVLLHRTGFVPVGQPSVLVAVAATHRREAFAACEWLIDRLKEHAAIWKKEVFDDGSGRWIGAPTEA